MPYSITGRYSSRRAATRPRKTYRRYAAKKRTYRKRAVRSYRKPMSKRKILNVTSEKKRDKMLTWTNTTAANPSGGTTYSANPAILAGGSPTIYCFPFCATARDNTTGVGGTNGAGIKYDASTRTSTTCYMVGLKERLEIQVADGLPWQWRRICFTAKGKATLNSALPTPGSSFAPTIEISVGFTRVINGLNATQQSAFYALLFQGTFNDDWVDPMTAQLDRERITVKYDKTCTIASGNEDGVIRAYNRWHPMRHNLVYDDDETGGTTTPAAFSALGKAGMGDYWVVDFFKPRIGSSSTNQLSFNAESTLYWHEK